MESCDQYLNLGTFTLINVTKIHLMPYLQINNENVFSSSHESK